MAALTKDRDTAERRNRDFSIPAAASKTFYAGALMCVSATGYGTPGATATTLKALGRVKRQVVSPAVDGQVTVEYERGLFRFANSTSTDLITRADIGSPAYIVDDQTVAKTNGSNTRSAAGIIRDVDDLGVWVEF
ncbi:hypothetical protein K9U40_10260 [Xanthobacter autotrophicus]|uniref:hypothetical protein n=1 Tax=Xanthobacter TaxID=279 RepID=UPI0024AA1F27|nr:hypothetical protein [Xanthobacter autotrophicus]MDI4664708.1 hypothetical protein [Xanthobacter autotrophicus]